MLLFIETYHSYCILVIHSSCTLISLNTSELLFHHSRPNTFLFWFVDFFTSAGCSSPNPGIPGASRSRGRFQVVQLQVQRWIELHVQPLRALSQHELYKVTPLVEFFKLLYPFLFYFMYCCFFLFLFKQVVFVISSEDFRSKASRKSLLMLVVVAVALKILLDRLHELSTTTLLTLTCRIRYKLR